MVNPPSLSQSHREPFCVGFLGRTPAAASRSRRAWAHLKHQSLIQPAIGFELSSMSGKFVSAAVSSTSRPAVAAQVFSLLASDRQAYQVGLPRQLQTSLGMHLPQSIAPSARCNVRLLASIGSKQPRGLRVESARIAATPAPGQQQSQLLEWHIGASPPQRLDLRSRDELRDAH